MIKILKYSFTDLTRSRWIYLYFGFYLVLTLALFWLSSNLANVILSLMNVILVLVPLVATLFGVTYYYHTREFTELLLAQPVRRRWIFLGQYLGLGGSLSLSLLLGVGVPFLFQGIIGSDQFTNYLTLLGTGMVLSFIFAALAMLIALRNDNRIRGFGLAVLVWLFFAVIYDGIFLVLLATFSDYPLEKFAMIASMANPIDLSRILITLQLDIAALMGYTGAVIQKLLGSTPGILLACSILIAWIVVPVGVLQRVARKKDF
ncbi:MAG: ABC transporter permease [Saprospiraceae bacterium]|nr:ABC transporter permease [Saprospiraceae bacterium]